MGYASSIKASKISESLENYSLSDGAFRRATDTTPTEGPNTHTEIVRMEVEFWDTVVHHREIAEKTTFDFRYGAVLSEWVARVPGLYYQKGSDLLRKLRKEDVEYVSDKWTHLTPIGKSRKVMGGLGTLKFSPDQQGYRLVSLTMSYNASAGIPALIHPRVWEHYNLHDGVFINSLKARWRTMPSTWSSKFATTRNIPKACLIVDHPDQLKCQGEVRVVRHHPFSIFKYNDPGGGQHFDFVFVNYDSDSGEEGRNNIRTFLGEYKYHDGRVGEYLIEPDISNPLIGDGDIVCQSPQELREKREDHKAYLELISHRIHDETFDDKSVDEIKTVMDRVLNYDLIQLMSDNLGMPANLWYMDALPVASNNAKFLEGCLERKIIPRLIDELIMYSPDAFEMI